MLIEEEYHHNWIIDNLPAASVVDTESFVTTNYAGGFPVGFVDGGTAFLFNHVNIIVEYYVVEGEGSRVVGFYAEPFSVKHKFANDQTWDGVDVRTAPPLASCDKAWPMAYEGIVEKQEVCWPFSTLNPRPQPCHHALGPSPSTPPPHTHTLTARSRTAR